MGVKTRKLGNISDSLVQWQSVVVADGSTGLTAVSGRGYFINTTSATQTVTLPASPVIGDTISIVDYASTFATNKVTVDPGSNKIEGSTTDASLLTNDQTHTFVFTDSTQGWKIVNQDTAAGIQPAYNTATGGTVTTSGNFKIHTFTGDSNFVVSAVGNPAGGGAIVDYLVVAGGGAGAGPMGVDSAGGGGGGAGGFRMSNNGCVMPGPTTSPLASPTGITLTAQTYPITVGAGGTVNGNPPGGGGTGSNSVFSTITSAGGGGGGGHPGGPVPTQNGQNGGSGGGAGRASGGNSSPGGGTGNTPPVSPPQGNNGGSGHQGAPAYGQGGGGGAGAAGNGTQNATPTAGGNGGIGSFLVQTGFAGCNGTPGPVSDVKYFAGGGGGGTYQGGTKGPGGAGGGGASNYSPNNPSSPGIAGVSGGTNTGGGGGGMSQNGSGGVGGKGIVIIRYKYQN